MFTILLLAELDDIELNDHQRAIVDQIHGGLLVLAPVGTGQMLLLAESAASSILDFELLLTISLLFI